MDVDDIEEEGGIYTVSKSLSNLPLGKYIVKVRSRNVHGYSDWSEEYTFERGTYDRNDEANMCLYYALTLIAFYFFAQLIKSMAITNMPVKTARNTKTKNIMKVLISFFIQFFFWLTVHRRRCIIL